MRKSDTEFFVGLFMLFFFYKRIMVTMQNMYNQMHFCHRFTKYICDMHGCILKDIEIVSIFMQLPPKGGIIAVELSSKHRYDSRFGLVLSFEVMLST